MLPTLISSSNRSSITHSIMHSILYTLSHSWMNSFVTLAVMSFSTFFMLLDRNVVYVMELPHNTWYGEIALDRNSVHLTIAIYTWVQDIVILIKLAEARRNYFTGNIKPFNLYYTKGWIDRFFSANGGFSSIREEEREEEERRKEKVTKKSHKSETSSTVNHDYCICPSSSTIFPNDAVLLVTTNDYTS